MIHAHNHIYNPSNGVWINYINGKRANKYASHYLTNKYIIGIKK